MAKKSRRSAREITPWAGSFHCAYGALAENSVDYLVKTEPVSLDRWKPLRKIPHQLQPLFVDQWLQGPDDVLNLRCCHQAAGLARGHVRKVFNQGFEMSRAALRRLRVVLLPFVKNSNLFLVQQQPVDVARDAAQGVFNSWAAARLRVDTPLLIWGRHTNTLVEPPRHFLTPRGIHVPLAPGRRQGSVIRCRWAAGQPQNWACQLRLAAGLAGESPI